MSINVAIAVLSDLSDFMGSVIVTFKIMPENVEINLDSLEELIKKEINPQRMERVPVAFGLNAIKIVLLVKEKEGEMDRVTEKIRSIDGVREVEVIALTRSL
jgi:elongation factor 1-beta